MDTSNVWSNFLERLTPTIGLKYEENGGIADADENTPISQYDALSKRKLFLVTTYMTLMVAFTRAAIDTSQIVGEALRKMGDVTTDEELDKFIVETMKEMSVKFSEITFH